MYIAVLLSLSGETHPVMAGDSADPAVHLGAQDCQSLHPATGRSSVQDALRAPPATGTHIPSWSVSIPVQVKMTISKGQGSGSRPERHHVSGDSCKMVLLTSRHKDQRPMATSSSVARAVLNIWRPRIARVHFMTVSRCLRPTSRSFPLRRCYVVAICHLSRHD
ncbi:hypothetical protein VTO73DRAFT_2055 [Trametes versicolor]